MMRRQTVSRRRISALWLAGLSLLLLTAAGCVRVTEVTVISYLPYSVEVYEQSPTLDGLQAVVPPFGTSKRFFVKRDQPFRLRFQRDDGRLVQVFYYGPDVDAGRATLTLAVSEISVICLPDVPPQLHMTAPDDPKTELWYMPVLYLVAGAGWCTIVGRWLLRWLTRRQLRIGGHSA
jgi:hypothetical protein